MLDALDDYPWDSDGTGYDIDIKDLDDLDDDELYEHTFDEEDDDG